MFSTFKAKSRHNLSPQEINILEDQESDDVKLAFILEDIKRPGFFGAVFYKPVDPDEAYPQYAIWSHTRTYTPQDNPFDYPEAKMVA